MMRLIEPVQNNMLILHHGKNMMVSNYWFLACKRERGNHQRDADVQESGRPSGETLH